MLYPVGGTFSLWSDSLSHTQARTGARTHTHTHTRAHGQAHTRTDTHTYAHSHTHTHTHTQPHTHTSQPLGSDYPLELANRWYKLLALGLQTEFTNRGRVLRWPKRFHLDIILRSICCWEYWYNMEYWTVSSVSVDFNQGLAGWPALGLSVVPSFIVWFL